MDFNNDSSIINAMPNLRQLSTLLQEGAPVTKILLLFRHMSTLERQYLFNQTHIQSEDEFVELLTSRSHRPPDHSELMDFPEQRLRQNLLLYVPPILIVLGTVGNVLSFFVLRCRAMVKVSSYHYLASLAVADTFVLYIGLLRLWLEELIEDDFQDHQDWVCKLTVTLGYVASDLSVWLIIVVTVERYIVVCFPLRASTMINTQRAKKVIVLLVLLMFIINLHFFWTVQLVEHTVGGNNFSNCEASPEHQRLVNEVWPWVDAFIYSFLPFLFIIVLNIRIIREVLKARNHRHRMQNTQEYQPHLSQHQQHPVNVRVGGQCLQSRTSVSPAYRRGAGANEGTKLTVMLLTVSFTFLLTTLPLNITLIFTAFWNERKHQPQAVAQFSLAKTVAELLMYVNHSINFCLYCATGHKFRQQIAGILCCRKQDRSPSWTSVHTENTRLTASVRFHNRPSQRLLMTSLRNDCYNNGAGNVSRTKV